MIGEWAALLGSVGAACALIGRLITGPIIKDVAAVDHRVRNQVARIDALEHLRTSDIERIVKLESAVQNFDKAIERIERGQDKLAENLNDRFDQLAESIREVRDVKPRS